MKIISQFKDFYDYKVAEYGLDETLVFDRRDAVLLDSQSLMTKGVFDKPNDTDALHSVLYVGNQLVHLFGTDSQVYTHFDFANLEDLTLYSDYLYFGEPYEIQLLNGKTINITSYLSFANGLTLDEQIQKSRRDNIYDVKGQLTASGKQLFWEDFAEKPLVLLRKRRRDGAVLVDANPFLAQAGIYLDPDFVWQNIVQFLSDLKNQKEITPEVSNDEKIANKGFDKKNSFRPKMKKKK